MTEMETYEDIAIRQRATTIRLLERVSGALICICILLAVPIVLGIIGLLIGLA